MIYKKIHIPHTIIKTDSNHFKLHFSQLELKLDILIFLKENNNTNLLNDEIYYTQKFLKILKRTIKKENDTSA